MHAENINQEATAQNKLLKRVSDKTERARAGLEKKNSSMLDLVSKYRDTNKCWKDVVLIVMLLVLIGLNIKAC